MRSGFAIHVFFPTAKFGFIGLAYLTGIYAVFFFVFFIFDMFKVVAVSRSFEGLGFVKKWFSGSGDGFAK